MLKTEKTLLAFEIALTALNGQKGKDSQPYINHALWMAEQFSGENQVCTAILCDVFEGAEASPDILRQDFPPTVVEALWALKQRENEPYEAYIRRVKQNDLAAAVKIVDLEYAKDLRRLQKIKKKDVERARKYKWAYQYLLGECDTE